MFLKIRPQGNDYGDGNAVRTAKAHINLNAQQPISNRTAKYTGPERSTTQMMSSP